MRRDQRATRRDETSGRRYETRRARDEMMMMMMITLFEVGHNPCHTNQMK